MSRRFMSIINYSETFLIIASSFESKFQLLVCETKLNDFLLVCLFSWNLSELLGYVSM